MRTHGSRHQQDAVKGVPAKQMQNVYEVRTRMKDPNASLHRLLDNGCNL